MNAKQYDETPRDYADDEPNMFYRISFYDPDAGENVVDILSNPDGESVTRLDASVYPWGSDLSAAYEHPEGIQLLESDAKAYGIEEEE